MQLGTSKTPRVVRGIATELYCGGKKQDTSGQEKHAGRWEDVGEARGPEVWTPLGVEPVDQGGLCANTR